MNGPFQTARGLTATTLPVEFEVLAPPPLLLPGERLDHYHALRQAIFADLAPQSAIEWLLAIDVAELSWEIQRYRLLRHRLLATYRQQAIEAALRRIDMAGIAPEVEDEADYYTRQNALSWRLDPVATTQIEERLASYGFDQHSINTDVYVQAREVFVLFEGLLNAAQARRLMFIREIKKHRYLA
ncbi:hypothetical protein [Bradyrhizobium tropiciagri]|uniref:hypothetical protein n=1 Tax=Bradyrhizobium tropiciagri TaxID=312253 RepID=UPI00067BEE0B|nr:hypothetical protein [Bradyrhizobium tropiciagri]